MFVLDRGARRLGYLTAMVMLCLSLSFSAAASVLAQNGSSIAQGFETTDTDIVTASLVVLKKSDTESIQLSTVDKTDSLVGVVSSKPLIELSHGTSEIQVVTSGLTLALVSDLNGEVKAGDKITASPIEGVGMKATESAMTVGTAQSDLSTIDTDERTITDKSGKTQKVKIGLLPVQVGVSFYSVDTEESSYVPPFLQQIANSTTGRNVSPIRVLTAAVILLLLFISVTVLLYSSVRSSIISIGRNPLSESAVRKSLLQVGITILTILVFGLTAMYLVVAL